MSHKLAPGVPHDLPDVHGVEGGTLGADPHQEGCILILAGDLIVGGALVTESPGQVDVFVLRQCWGLAAGPEGNRAKHWALLPKNIRGVEWVTRKASDALRRVLTVLAQDRARDTAMVQARADGLREAISITAQTLQQGLPALPTGPLGEIAKALGALPSTKKPDQS